MSFFYQASHPREATGASASAVLDLAHLGDIRGAFGTIRQGDTSPRKNWRQRLATLLAIIGPGLIVIVGAIAMMSFTAATFAGTAESGGFSDAAAVATGMERHF